jgi:hypothetical protein
MLVPQYAQMGAYFGHLGRAQELSRRAEGTALFEGDRATAADIEARMAFQEALFGDSDGARHHAAAALSLGEQPTVALALVGDTVLATNVADRLASHIPPRGFANKVWLPQIRAAIELKRGKPMQAVGLLAPVTPYEAGWGDNFLAA